MRSLIAVMNLTLVLLVAGCAGPAAVPEDSYYRLAQPEPETLPTGPLLNGGVAVAVTDTPALYQDRAIVYRTTAAPLQLRRYHYHYWSDAPARLLQQYLVEYFDRAGLADRVQAEDYDTDARYRLRVQLLRFDRIEAPDETGVEVALAFELDDLQTGTALAAARERHTLFTDGNAGMHATAALFESALARAGEAWLQRLVDTRP